MSLADPGIDRPANTPASEQPRPVKRLLLIYDAPSGRIAAFTDSLKKLLGKGCSLCSTTHGLATKRMGWQRFERQVGVPLEYLHEDEIAELEDRLGRQVELPCILAELEDGSLEELLGAGSIERASGSVDDLKGRLWLHARAKNLKIPYQGENPTVRAAAG